MPVGNPTRHEVLLITKRRRAPGESAAHRLEHDQVAALDPAVLDGGVERQRNRRGRRIGVAVDGDDHFFGRQTQLSRGCVEDPGVRLVGNDPVDVVRTRGRRRQALR